MTRPDTPFEAASYDLNQFIERRMQDRRVIQRNCSDRRQAPIALRAAQQVLSPIDPPSKLN